MSHKGRDCWRLSLAVFFTASNMPITRGYQILNKIDEKLERLSDDWERVQSKRRRGKKALFRKTMKQRMDLILKVIKKLQWCRGTLVRVNKLHGNSVERQRAKEEMESRLIDLDKLIEFFNKF